MSQNLERDLNEAELNNWPRCARSARRAQSTGKLSVVESANRRSLWPVHFFVAHEYGPPGDFGCRPRRSPESIRKRTEQARKATSR
jgi:hypothetical protein